MRFHRITDDQLSALAAGIGGSGIMAELNASRVSLHLMLLKRIADRWAADRPALDAAVGVLEHVQRAAPGVYAELIGDPLVGAWLTRTGPMPQPPEEACLRLDGLAVAAALRVPVEAELPAHADTGTVMLPTFGVGLLGTPVTGKVTVSVAPGGRVTCSGTEVGLRPMRWLRARHQGQKISVRLEDADPYRDGYHAPPSAPLDDAEFDHWQRLFTGAWQLLVDRLPHEAAEMAQGLRAIVPLVDQGDGSSRSGTARESVGAMCMSRPRTAADLAVTLVHEFQHSKLSAVIDIVPLYRLPGTERHRVPWRADPRPTAGLIQGVYAFLAVAETWQHFRAVPPLATVAGREFAEIRAQVEVGLRALERSEELTAAGRRFTTGLRARFGRLSAITPNG